jgi:hypothetical protein
MFYCGLMMLLITCILMVQRIRTGKALDHEGHFVAAMDNPVYFVIFTVLNFIFLLFISAVMIVLSIVE